MTQYELIRYLNHLHEEYDELDDRMHEISRVIVSFQSKCTHRYMDGNWAGELDFNPNHSCRVCGSWVPGTPPGDPP